MGNAPHDYFDRLFWNYFFYSSFISNDFLLPISRVTYHLLLYYIIIKEGYVELVFQLIKFQGFSICFLEDNLVKYVDSTSKMAEFFS